MTDYMKEAKRLIAAHESAIRQHDRGAEWDEGPAKTLSALLAHIQRGAVPEGDDGKRVLREVFALCEDTEAKAYEEPGDFARGRRFKAKGIARAIGAWYQEEFCGRTHMGEPAPAPDHFRDAAKMMAAQKPLPSDVAAILADNMHLMYESGAPAPAEPERWIGPASDSDMVVYQSIADGYTRDTAPAPAEVPMPEPDGELEPDGEGFVTLKDPLYDDGGDIYAPHTMRTYGERCRAAGEAAGYARGLNERNAGDETLAREIDLVMSDNGVTLTPGAFRALSFVCAALRGEVKP